MKRFELLTWMMWATLVISSTVVTNVAVAATDKHQALFEKVDALLNDFQQPNLNSQQLDQLELNSQDLISELKKCEKKAEEEVNRLVETRNIDALESQSTEENNNESDLSIESATAEVDKRINAATKTLISCRLSLSKMSDARLEIMAKKQDRWIRDLTQKQPVWQFNHSSAYLQNVIEKQSLPINVVYFLALVLGLVSYFLMVSRNHNYLVSSPPEKLWQLHLKEYIKVIIKTHAIPLLLAVLYFMVSDTNKVHMLVLFLGILARDACFFLHIKINEVTVEKPFFIRFMWVSTLFLMVLSFGWNELFFLADEGAQWASNQAMVTTPLFLVACGLLFWTAWMYKTVSDNGLNHAVAWVVVIATGISAVGYVLTYAGGAQYLLVLAAGLILVYWVLRTINTLRKLLLSKSIRKLKAKDEYKDATFSFPFWVSLVVILGSVLLGLIFMAWLGGLSADVYEQARFLFNEGFELGSVRLVPKDLLIGAIILMVIVSAFNKIRNGIQSTWFEKSRLRKSSREVFSMLVWYFGITIAVFVGLSFAGFDISNLAIIAGALSVGIGFGLQNIVSNFVSGLILLFERPVKRGDWVEVGDTVGFVEKVKIRATRIRTFDNAEILVPNSELLSHHVTNWTLSNSIGRITMKVGVAYGSDVAQVKDILDQIAKDHNQVMQHEPYKHKVLFREFGDSSLNFEMRVMIKDIKQILDVQSELNFAIEQALRDANITIPFPQRDLHLIDVPEQKNTKEGEPSEASDAEQPEQESGDHQGSEVEDRVKKDEQQASKEEDQNNSEESNA